MSKTFKFDPKLWRGNSDLRACSPAARGLWLDILCICHGSAGYLHVHGQPVDDNQLARMIGEPVKSVRGWLKELGEAGIFSVDDRGLYSSRMRRAMAPRAHNPTVKPKVVVKPKVAAVDVAEEKHLPQEAKPRAVQPAAPQKKQLEWYMSPAGWVRFAASQAMSMTDSESIEDFKVRVSARIPPGMHLDALTETQRKMVEAARPKDPYAKKDA